MEKIDIILHFENEEKFFSLPDAGLKPCLAATKNHSAVLRHFIVDETLTDFQLRRDQCFKK